MSIAGKRVLVTGADGFIGSHLVERLVREGARVRAFCLYNSQGSLGWLDGVAEEVRQQIEPVLGDIRDARHVRDAFRDMEIVFHLAALIAIPYSYVAPESFVDTNIRGTLNVLEAARETGTKRVVHTSTSEVYGTPDVVPILETHALAAQSPYAATKVAADQLARAYHLSFGVPVTTLRPFNTYGPRQSTRAVLPTILLALLEGKREVMLGRLDPKRDLTFVEDTVDGFVRAARAPNIEGDVIQLGTGQAVSIGDLFDSACRVLDVKAVPKVDPRRVRPDGSEVMVLLSDPAKALRLLAWKPTVSLDDGMARTAAWLRKNLGAYRSDLFHV